MKLLPIGRKKLVNLNLVFSIVVEDVMIVFNSVTGTYTTASKKDFKDSVEKFNKWKEKAIEVLKGKIV